MIIKHTKYYLVIYACAYYFYHWTKETNINSILFVFNICIYIYYIIKWKGHKK